MTWRRPNSLTDSRGFTIVELLIVIVVIGILAAITIVAYSGIQSRAVAASLVSDLDNASKKLKLYQVDNSGYPTSLDCSAAPLAGSICLKSSNGTAYTTFTPVNATNPQTFCLTANNGATNYYINQDGPPTSGGCAITNLIPNPSVEGASLAELEPYYSVPITIDSTIFDQGAKSAKVLTNSTIYPQGIIWWSGPQTAGTYSCSVSVAGTSGKTVRVSGRTTTPNNESMGSQTVSLASSFQRVAISYLAGSDVGNLGIQIVASDVQTGIEIYTDAVMCLKGSRNYPYADGSFAGWRWNGPVNNSSSTGPAQ